MAPNTEIDQKENSILGLVRAFNSWLGQLPPVAHLNGD